MPDHYDVIVIGGAAAGLSAALVLGRSRRSVLVVDAGEPRNAPSAGAHNYLGREGIAPAELSAIGRDEVAAYGVEVTAGRIVAASATTGDGTDPVGFSVTLDSGTVVTARRLVVASGAVDVLPQVPGLAEQWGRGVVHCPFCHGWEIRDQRIGVLVTTPNGVHHALMFRALSEHVTAFVTDPALVDDTALAGLQARGIEVVDDTVTQVLSSEGTLTGVTLGSGEVVELDALAAASTAEAGVDFLSGLGLVATDQFMGDFRYASALTVDPAGQTSVRGVYAAGNVAAPMATVIASAAAGVQAGAAAHGDLVQADLAAALAAAGARAGA
ncbi:MULTISPECIES: NAD(P)/FAD-dependent oxidoreductase [unclassified Curtobacterium]|uniref:NAD(P)/FAD-dependent oxidoreductase n=1 Tax=unclassified Curtobacterium TaxID=257496 RepID=UPI000F47F3AC|nr:MULTISPECIES: NAD(P)/FAD-dependent oxidoreductase [unclassified Curtobacterium]ROQ16827.1 thioredoxin reductase (NADPH) [Curtobacterium sp. PhB171]ROQ25096.1 thioredoxin reductase (NADPH) [Curtobacterium sp. PhB170]ROS36547.1 thioredoxin reductase (NADPH) [Curtobacterium sp. PhB131]ROS71225.1 thioredoxin reductase (NADPH) [Curtobacterium sp. PhB141]